MEQRNCAAPGCRVARFKGGQERVDVARIAPYLLPGEVVGAGRLVHRDCYRRFVQAHERRQAAQRRLTLRTEVRVSGRATCTG